MVWYKNVSDWWLGVGNAIAAGMMTAASVALLSEGLDLPGSPRYGVACGVLTGVVFILGSQRIMERNDPNGDVKLAVLGDVNARKAHILALLAGDDDTIVAGELASFAAASSPTRCRREFGRMRRKRLGCVEATHLRGNR